jgi:hypothetical protein
MDVFHRMVVRPRFPVKSHDEQTPAIEGRQQSRHNPNPIGKMPHSGPRGPFRFQNQIFGIKPCEERETLPGLREPIHIKA